MDSTAIFTNLNTARTEYFFTAYVKHDWSGNPKKVPFSWIEGLGNLQGAGMETILPAVCHSDWPYLKVICILDSSGTQLYQNPSYSICDGIGTPETNHIQLSIFPNPASTFVEIKTSFLNQIQHIQIINSSGLIVDQITVFKGERIDISQLPAGFFNLKITSKNGDVVFKKLVVERD